MSLIHKAVLRSEQGVLTMPLLGQLVYTSFPGVGFKALASAQVPIEIQQAFIQQVVHQRWNSYKPPSSGYRAAYIHQVTLEHTLFGWLYNDEVDDLGRTNVPYFVCYYLAELLHADKIENIFTCLHKGPVALIDQQHLPVALETIVAPDLWSHLPAHIGVAIPASVRERSHVVLKQKKLLDAFVSVDEGVMVTELNGQVYKHQKAPLQPSLTATQVPQAPPCGQDTISAFRGNLSKPQVGDKTNDASVPTFSNKSTFLIGIAIGSSTLALIAIPLMFWRYYFLQTPPPPSKVQQYQMISSRK